MRLLGEDGMGELVRTQHVCRYTYIYIYSHIHTYTYCIYIYINKHSHTHKQILSHVCVYMVPIRTS